MTDYCDFCGEPTREGNVFNIVLDSEAVISKIGSDAVFRTCDRCVKTLASMNVQAKPVPYEW